jgi:hypothetical protein
MTFAAPLGAAFFLQSAVGFMAHGCWQSHGAPSLDAWNIM